MNLGHKHILSWGKICQINQQMKIVHSVICTIYEINHKKLVKSEPLNLPNIHLISIDNNI